MGRSATGKNPRSASAAYSPGAQWPLLSTKRSRLGSWGCSGSMRISRKYRYVRTSAADRLPPGWPDPAPWVASITPIRTRVAVSFNCSVSSFVIVKFLRSVSKVRRYTPPRNILPYIIHKPTRLARFFYKFRGLSPKHRPKSRVGPFPLCVVPKIRAVSAQSTANWYLHPAPICGIILHRACRGQPLSGAAIRLLHNIWGR